MIDPWNPTREEIIEWAYSDELEPEQDWNLAVTEINNASLLLTLASDDNCPKRLYFLFCLYLLVGDDVRTNGGAHGGVEAITLVLNHAEVFPHGDIIKWIERSRQLLAEPNLFVYSDWCDGGFVRKDYHTNTIL